MLIISMNPKAPKWEISMLNKRRLSNKILQVKLHGEASSKIRETIETKDGNSKTTKEAPSSIHGSNSNMITNGSNPTSKRSIHSIQENRKTNLTNSNIHVSSKIMKIKMIITKNIPVKPKTNKTSTHVNSNTKKPHSINETSNNNILENKKPQSSNNDKLANKMNGSTKTIKIDSSNQNLNSKKKDQWQVQVLSLL